MERIEGLQLKAYAIRNSKGDFFKSKGYGGYGKNWVPELKDAKVYLKIGSARRVVTYYNNLDNDEYGPPELIELTLSSAIILDETKRLEKAKLKKKKDKLSQELRNAEYRLKVAERELKNIANKTEEIEVLKNQIKNLNGDTIK